MASEQHKGFCAQEYPLQFMAGKPVINLAFLFFDVDTDGNEVDKDFSAQTGSSFKIWEDNEDGKLLLSLSEGSGIVTSGNVKTMNTSSNQMDLLRGKYYYEHSYYNSGGYENVLMFGEVKFI